MSTPNGRSAEREIKGWISRIPLYRLAITLVLLILSLGCVSYWLRIRYDAHAEARAKRDAELDVVAKFVKLNGGIGFMSSDGWTKSYSDVLEYQPNWLRPSPPPLPPGHVAIFFTEDFSGTDSDLSDLKLLTRVNYVSMDSARKISDAGLVHLRPLGTLQTLDLSYTRITDAGLEHLSELQSLENLYLPGTPVTDKGLIHLRRLTNLRVLLLGQTRIAGPGLAYLSDLKKLRTLRLYRTPMTDAGLVHLRPLISLKELDLDDTQVTAKGLATLPQHLQDGR